MVLGITNLGLWVRIWGYWYKPENWHFFVSRCTLHPHATAGRLGTRQATGTHIGTGGQCADTIEAGVGADGPACILHTGMGSVGLGQVNGVYGAQLGGQTVLVYALHVHW